jgi:uncharacterized protein
MTQDKSNVSGDDDCLVTRRNFEIPLGNDIFLLPAERGYVLYAPRFRTAIELTPAQILLLMARINEPTVLSQHLSALLGKDIVRREQPKREMSYQPTTTALMLTSACQLRCTYCYAKAGETPKENLDMTIAMRAIDYAAKNAVDRGLSSFSVHIHGAGEPTLRGDAIRRLLKYAKAIAKASRLGVRTLMSTNFSVTREDALYYAKNIDSLHVSCDGPSDVMRANRPAAKGDDRAHELTYRALETIARAHLINKVVVRCTVTRQSQHRLAEIVEFFNKLGVKSIYMVGVSSLGRGICQGDIEPSRFVQDFRTAKVVARKLGTSLFYPGVDVHRVRTDGYSCGINGSNFVVLPNGEVSLCYEAVVRQTPQRDFFSIGRIASDQIAIDSEKVREVGEATHVDRRSVCASCFCQLTCAGQCAARNYAQGKEVRNVEMTLACDITRTLTMDEIKSKLL